MASAEAGLAEPAGKLRYIPFVPLLLEHCRVAQVKV